MDFNNYVNINTDIPKLNIKKIYKAYGITDGEAIVAYVRSPYAFVPLSKSGIIITDKALYIKRVFHNNGKPKKIAISDLCGYAIVTDSLGLYIINSETQECIFSGIPFGNNDHLTELADLMVKAQADIIQKDDYSKSRYISEMDKLIEHIRCNMNNITGAYDAAIAYLENCGSFKTKGLLLRAEYIFRQCNQGDLTAFINSKDSSDQKIITKSLNGFAERMINEISDKATPFNTKNAKKIYNNLKCCADLSKEYAAVLAYVSVIVSDYSEYCRAKDILSNKYDEISIRKLEMFRGFYCNSKMRMIVNKLSENEKISKEDCKVRDGIGFSILHYAIVTRNADTIKILLKKSEWDNKCFIWNGCDISDMFNYNVAAAIADVDCRFEICEYTSDTIRSIKKMVAALNRRIVSREVIIRLQRGMINNLRKRFEAARRENDYYTITSIVKEIENCEDIIRQAENTIREAEKEIEELETEIQEAMISELETAEQIAINALKSNDPFVQLIVRLYREPEFIKSVLFDNTENIRLYRYKDRYFITPAWVNIDLVYYSSADGQPQGTEFQHKSSYKSDSKKQSDSKKPNTKAEKFNRPYGDSWYSPEAHKNEKLLKSEYHRLAKIYHPDVSNHPNCKEIFQEFSNERADILDKLS